MPKLSEIKIDIARTRGRGLRPWNGDSVSNHPDSVSKALASGGDSVSNHPDSVSKALASGGDSVSNHPDSVSKALASGGDSVSNHPDSVSKALASGGDSVSNHPDSVSKALASGGDSVSNHPDSVSKALASGGDSVSNHPDSVSKALASGGDSVSNHPDSVSKALASGGDSVSNHPDSVSKALASGGDSVSNHPDSVSKALASGGDSVSNHQKGKVIFPVGKERELLLFLVRKCKLFGSLETPPITTSELTKALEITPVRLRNLIFRLSNKGIIDMHEKKNGRGGWRKFNLSKEIFKQFSFEEKSDKALARTKTSSSSSLNKKLTTNKLNNYICETVDNSDGPELGYWQIEPNVVTTKQFQTWLKEFELTEAPLVAYLDRCRFEMVELGKEEKLNKGSAVNWFYGVMKKRGGSYPEPPGYKSIQQLKLEEEEKILEQAEAIEIERQEVKLKQEFAAMMADSSSASYQNHLKALGQYAKKLDETGPAFRAIMWEEFKKQNTLPSLNASSN